MNEINQLKLSMILINRNCLYLISWAEQFFIKPKLKEKDIPFLQNPNPNLLLIGLE